MEPVRIDKWLWAARFYKTRSAATDAVLGGRVHVNGARVKPSKEIRAGDIVEIRVGQLEWIVVVRGISDKRGSASVASMLYDETPESAIRREQRAAELRLARPFGADLGARPTKQARRRIEGLREIAPVVVATAGAERTAEAGSRHLKGDVSQVGAQGPSIAWTLTCRRCRALTFPGQTRCRRRIPSLPRSRTRFPSRSSESTGVPAAVRLVPDEERAGRAATIRRRRLGRRA